MRFFPRGCGVRMPPFEMSYLLLPNGEILQRWKALQDGPAKMELFEFLGEATYPQLVFPFFCCGGKIK